MAQSATIRDLGIHFQSYIEGIREVWGSGDVAQAAASARDLMAKLLAETPAGEPWIADLLRDKPSGRELYRDPDHGFIQMGHYHQGSHGNQPHDHGPCWVVYGVYQGEVEIPRYHRVDDGSEPGKAQLEVERADRLTPGVAIAYLPGETHSTRCLSAEGAIVLRFLSADLETVQRRRYNTKEGTISLIQAAA
ncbi:MAG TPA: hypothetical protein VMW62_12395 [Chloroflexota bacterium]|nr:hypothetical protein [Chloroflexota bacterium]